VLGGGAISGHHSGLYWGQIRLSFPDELRIELIYPQDATAERYFRGAQPA
jgi:hypothetical protein